MRALIGLLLLMTGITGVKAAKVDTIAIFSNAMHRSYKCVVVTPDGYGKSNDRFPVIYMLHGHSGNYSNYIKKVPAIATLADTYKTMIVCPDGGFDSWYLDSPVDSTVRFETYVGTEVPSWIDSHYRTIADRKHRAIMGLSMGGHGAMYLAIRHQKTFGAAGSMSGGVDVRPFPKNWNLPARLGSYKEHPENWDRDMAVSQLDSLKNKELALIVDCGIKDFFIDVNRQFHARLLELGIFHDYIERPGEHNWEYWNTAVPYQFLFFHRFFEAK
jgi:S-formylglutathione hydrolase FrmB